MTASEPDRQLVLFSLHGDQYALPISAVREIIRYIAPSATATATGLITGMINLRGRVLPIVDLSPRLGRQLEVTSGTRILVVEVANGVLGMIVDSVDGVRDIPAAQIEPLPVAASEQALGDQIAAVGDRLILLVDPERALGGVLPSPPKPATPKAATPKPAAPKPAARKRPATKPAATKPTTPRRRATTRRTGPPPADT